MKSLTKEDLAKFGRFVLTNAKSGSCLEGTIEEIEIQGEAIKITTSNVVKHLVLPKRKKPLNDIELMVNFSDYKLLSYRDGSVGFVSQKLGELIVLIPSQSAS